MIKCLFGLFPLRSPCPKPGRSKTEGKNRPKAGSVSVPDDYTDWPNVTSFSIMVRFSFFHNISALSGFCMDINSFQIL
jgi:hypothetical protein